VASESLGEKLARLFVEQGGVATTAQLREAGLSAERLGRLVRRGVLVSPRRGTYAPMALAKQAAGNNVRAEALRVAAAIARSRFELIGSHRSAAQMHGLDQLTVQSARVVTVTQPRLAAEGNRSGYAGMRLYTAELPGDHVTKLFGVPCTTVPRTVIDLARSESFTAGVVVADNALHTKKTTGGELQAVLAHCAWWPGIVTARRVLE